MFIFSCFKCYSRFFYQILTACVATVLITSTPGTVYSNLASIELLTNCESISSDVYAADFTLETDRLRIELGRSGEVTGLIDRNSKINYVPNGQPGSLMRIRSGGQDLIPLYMAVDGTQLSFDFENGLHLVVEAIEYERHLRFELVEVNSPEQVEAVFWGPFNTTIGDTIGEVVGVVRNTDFAIGIRALNTKTIGGKLQNEEGFTTPSATISGSAASNEEFGSALQAFILNQSLDRSILVWHHHENVSVPGLEDYSLTGTAIALFGSSPPDALGYIGHIKQEEGLPVPTINGEWIRTSGITGRPYLITSFTEETADEFISLAKRLGFYSVYHEGPFSNWGHFELREDQFPNGLDGMRHIVKRAEEQNIRIGVHTLTNFITTNDPFVTTTANSGLMAAGYATILQDIDEAETEIVVDRYDYFAQVSTLNSVRIGNEIIRYEDVSSEEPYRLMNVVRGAFGTTPAAHPKGEVAAKLMDFPYRTLFPGWDMQNEMIQNLVDFFNETGVSHMDFDGHEGTYYTGRGDFALNHFADEFLNGTGHFVVNGSSVINHFYWNHNSYINWGEPWYASFRESQSEHRFRLQPFFERNYMPNMLGWFLVTPDTRLEDIEWMMAAAAGYNAGYALVVRYNALMQNPLMDDIVDTIVNWEHVRRQGLFNSGQLLAMRNPDNEFRLLQNGSEQWALQHMESFSFEHEYRIMQPGEPAHSRWEFVNNHERQPLYLELHVTGGSNAEVQQIELEINQFFSLQIPVTLTRGQTLIWDSSTEVKVYSDRGQLLQTIDVGQSLPPLRNGPHVIEIDARTFSGEAPVIRGKVKLAGETETLHGG